MIIKDKLLIDKRRKNPKRKALCKDLINELLLLTFGTHDILKAKVNYRENPGSISS